MGYRSLKVIQTGPIQKLGCSFLFTFHSNYGRIFQPFKSYSVSKNSMTLKTGLRVVQSYWIISEIIVNFFHTLLRATPLLGSPHQSIAIPFGAEKLEWWGCTMAKNFEDTCNCLDRIPACDRQTDRQTDRQSFCSIVRAMHTCRAVKQTKCALKV